MNEAEQPQDLTINRQEGTLNILWRDGHRSTYPLTGLRNVCPCAECRGGHEHMGGPVDRVGLTASPALPLEAAQISGANLVGNYALSFTWADGHDAGIYTWPFLRALCPCPECEMAAQSREAAAP